MLLTVNPGMTFQATEITEDTEKFSRGPSLISVHSVAQFYI